MISWLLAMGLAVAGPVDLYGFGAESIGRGQGGLSIPDGSLTVFRNPALLRDQDMAQAVMGFGVFRGRFPRVPPVYWDTNRDGMVDDLDAPLKLKPDAPSADGLTLSMGRNVGQRAGIGMNGFLPTQQILRLHTTEPALPTWVMYGNRSERFEIALGGGIEIAKGLSVGTAVELVAKARYRVNATFNAVATGVEGEDAQLGDAVDTVALDVHEMTLDLVPNLVPIVGLAWDLGELSSALSGLRAAAVWRGPGGIPVDADLDMQINGSLEEVGDLEPVMLTLVLPLEFHIFDHYVPERLSLGASYRHARWIRGYVDVHRTMWSALQLNVAHVTAAEIKSQFLQISSEEIEDLNQFRATFVDTWSVNTGAEVWMPALDVGGAVGSVDIVLRGGMGYVPSPLAAQSSSSFLLDADRVLLTVGTGVVHGDPFELVPGPVSWDAYFTTHKVAEGELNPVDAGPHRPGSPINGRSIPIGGHLWSGGIQWGVGF